MADAENKIEEALQKRDQADYLSYMSLKELLKLIEQTGEKEFLKSIKDIDEDLCEDAKEILNNAHETIKVREKANDDFMRAVANNPIVLGIQKA